MLLLVVHEGIASEVSTRAKKAVDELFSTYRVRGRLVNLSDVMISNRRDINNMCYCEIPKLNAIVVIFG